MQTVIIILIILLVVLYYLDMKSLEKIAKLENFTNINSKKYENSIYNEPQPEDWDKVGYRNLFDWNKSKAIPISKEANQIAYDINSTEPTGLAYNSRFPWSAPSANTADIPNSQMNLIN